MTDGDGSVTRRRYSCLPREDVRRSEFSLTTVQDADVEPIRQWRNAQMDILRQKAPITEAQQSAYFARHIWPTLTAREPANVLVAYHEGDRLVGYGGLVHVAWEHSRAEVSFLLDPVLAADDAGYAAYFSVFLALVKELAFDDLGLYRLFTETFDVRDNHIRVLESCGFQLEGRLRAHVRIDGVAVDSLIHGSLSSEQ